MLIISPYARAGFTDSTPATFVSMLNFIESTYGLAPLNPCATVDSGTTGCTDDKVGLNGGAPYDFMDAFDFSQTPLGATPLVHTKLGAYDRRHQAAWGEAAGDDDT